MAPEKEELKDRFSCPLEYPAKFPLPCPLDNWGVLKSPRPLGGLLVSCSRESLEVDGNEKRSQEARSDLALVGREEGRGSLEGCGSVGVAERCG